MSNTALVCLIVAGVIAVAVLASYLTSFRLMVPLLLASGLARWRLPYGLWAVVLLAACLGIGLPFLGYRTYRLHRARRLRAVWTAIVEAFHSHDGRGAR